MHILDRFASELPTIELVHVESGEYPARRKIYNAAVKTKPLAFAIPKTAEEVASIVKFAGRTGVDISVRCGGHELFGRSLVDNGIVIDVRALNDIRVEKAAGKAVIGGGVQSRKLCKVLGDHGCLTPCPNIATVGYIGYAATGGYGQMVHKLGLGVDNLLSAKIVDAEGNIVEADDDVMRAIRGAGGNFGIVVEATIKIYPFSTILAGAIIFESSDWRKSMNNVQDGMETLITSGDCPDELDIQPMYGVGPMGAFYGALFLWAGPDLDRARVYLDKITAFHPVIMSNVGPITTSETLEANAALVPESSYCNARTVNVRRITPKIYKILVDACETMPVDLAAMLTWHGARACSPSFDPKTYLPAAFNAREAHTVIEILSNAVDEANYKAVSEWGITLRDRLLREAPEEVMDATWLASTPTSEIESLEKLYGRENADFLRRLKREKDPKGIFKHALPNLLQ